MESKIRTEEEILKDFEELDWHVVDGYAGFMLKKLEKKQETFGEGRNFCYTCHCFIRIDKEKHTYSAIDNHCFTTHEYELSMQEHKLLTELFTIWGWL